MDLKERNEWKFWPENKNENEENMEKENGKNDEKVKDRKKRKM